MAATACDWNREGKLLATKRLDTILQSQRSAIIKPERHLDNMYAAILEQSVPEDSTDVEKEEIYHLRQRVLGSLVVLFDSLSVSSISRLLDTGEDYISQTVYELHSLLDVPAAKTAPLRLHHSSFRDFITNKERCTDPRLVVSTKHAHQTLVKDCVLLMSRSLKQYICGTMPPGSSPWSIDLSQIQQYLPLEVWYACIYWIDHVQKSEIQPRDNEEIHEFLKKHLLHWLEALCWMRMLREGIMAITVLES